MTVTINGTTGIDKVQDGTIQSADFAAGVPARSNLPAGTVLQVVSSNFGTYPTSTTSTSFVTTGHSATITPTSSNSKIYIILHFQTLSAGGAGFTIYRNGANINTNGFAEANLGSAWTTMPITYLDSPASSSAQTYTVYFKAFSGTVYYCGNTNEYCTLTLMEIAA